MTSANHEAILELPVSTRLILTSGIVRSGSTWLYNATRFILQTTQANVYACWIDDFSLADAANAEIVIVKLHSPDDAVAARAEKIVTSYRDLRDIAVSARSMGWHHSTEKLLEVALAARYCDDYWSARAQLVAPYERIVAEPAALLSQLAATLGSPLSQNEIDRIASALSGMREPDATTYDRTTLLHPGHRNDGRPGRWRDELEPDIVAGIEEQSRDWLVARGYLAGNNPTPPPSADA